jgi:Ca2+-binding RTX toxin-like protein
LYYVGSGNDTIAENTVSAATDKVKLINLNLSDVTLSRSGTHLFVTINSTGEQLKIQDHFLGTTNGIEQIVFADGTVLDRNQILSLVPTQGTAGNDTLNGSAGEDLLLGAAGNDTLFGGTGNDILIGGTGNDSIEGGWGNDTFRFNLGDGQDTVNDAGINGDLDVLDFGSGISASNVTVTQVNSSTLAISINGTSDKVTLTNQLASVNGGVDQVHFADGTTWSRAAILAASTTPTSGNDTFCGDFDSNSLSGGAGNDNLYGANGNDILTGGTGNDSLEGGWGNDTFHFDLGDGQDSVNDAGINGDLDVLDFGSGISASNVTVTQVNSSTLAISINGTSDKVTLTNQLASVNGGVDQVHFADGTTWSRAAILAASTTPTSGNDTFYGDFDNNALDGGFWNHAANGDARPPRGQLMAFRSAAIA